MDRRCKYFCFVGKKSFTARVIAQNDCKKWLEDLDISTDGIVLGYKTRDTSTSFIDQSSQTSFTSEPLTVHTSSTSCTPPENSLPNVSRSSSSVLQHHQCSRLLSSTAPELHAYLPSSTPSTSSCLPPDDEDVDLISGSGVKINEIELFNIKKQCKDQPTKMLRKLLTTIVGINELKTMSRTGGNNLEPIPAYILKAVEKFTFKESSETSKITTSEFNKYVTQFLNDLRNSK